MFTGIVDHVGEVVERDGKKLSLRTHFKALELGESVSVDGACLTVTSFQANGVFTCDVSPETDSLTLTGLYQKGTLVNLERSLCLGDRMGGHWVTGHVDQRAQLSLKETVGDCVRMVFSKVDLDQRSFLFQKGSVCVNGVSLTVNAVSIDGFEVMLIPHTLERTNLRLLEMGAWVNLELDWMAKMIVGQTKKVLEAMHAVQ